MRHVATPFNAGAVPAPRPLVTVIPVGFSPRHPMGAADPRVVRAVRDGLAALADPVKAPQMQWYMRSMRSELPYRGVPTPGWRRLTNALVAEHPLSDVDTLLATVRTLWHQAAYREECYVALELTGHRRHAGWQTPALLPLYEELIVTGAWWDLVDEIAIRRIGPLLRAHPRAVRPVVLAWRDDGDRWKRRTSVICQVASKSATDTALLAECIRANLEDRDFFLRKGIGWALREHAKTDPDWVRGFVDDHPGLSPLSRREALRNLPPH